MSSAFDFLSNITLGEDVKPKASTGGGGLKKQRIPETADLRVFSTGAVYPSKALVEKYDLEYRHKDAKEVGNGFDIFSSKEWAVTAALPQVFLLIGAAPKDAPKVSLFNMVRYDKETGNPMTTVLEQGAPTFGKELLDYVASIYGATPNAEGFIDLVIVEAHALRTSNGLANIPKKIARGEKAGQESYERRENAIFYPLAVAEGHVSAPVEDKPQPKEDVKPAPEVIMPGAVPPITPDSLDLELEDLGTVEPPVQEETVEAPVAPEVPAEEKSEDELLNQPTMNELWPTEAPEAPAENEAPAEDSSSLEL